VLKLSSNVSDVFPKVLKLSFEVSECKPLVTGDYRKNGTFLDDAEYGQGLTLVQLSAQLEPCLTHKKHPLHAKHPRTPL